jgi:hypothetical protein
VAPGPHALPGEGGDGQPEQDLNGIERAYRTHWISPALSERKRKRLSERKGKPVQAVRAEAVQLAVIASIRHEDTDYDELLMTGVDRVEARERVHSDVDRALEAWRADAAVRG